jgi:hypothetical protein
MEGFHMKRVRRGIVALLVVSMIAITVCPLAQAQQDPTTDELNMLDLFVARPIGVASGIVGTALFVVALPFTIPAGGVNKAAKMLIVEPFRFSFTREFPDPNVQPNGYDY